MCAFFMNKTCGRRQVILGIVILGESRSFGVVSASVVVSPFKLPNSDPTAKVLCSSEREGWLGVGGFWWCLVVDLHDR